MPLRVANRDQLHHWSLVGLASHRVHGVALGIAKVLDLADNLTLVISRNHQSPPDKV